MTTTKSYSKSDKFGAAYVAALKTQSPFAIVSGVIFLILFVVVFFVNTVNSYTPAYAYDFFQNYFQQGIYVGIEQSIISLVLLLLLALASTLAGLSYLHSKKTVDLYHSLPVSRPKLLGANLLASLTAVMLPYLLMYMLTMLIQLVTCGGYGCFNAEYFIFILFDVAAALVYVCVLIAFIAFMAVNVGTVFDAFAVTMALGFSPPLIYVLCGFVWENLMYGAYFDPGEKLLYLSPFLFIFKTHMNVVNGANFERYGESVARNFGSLIPILLFGLLAAGALLAAAMVCYRRRKSEIAEQTQTRGVLQIIVKLIASFIGGSVFFAIFDDIGLTAVRVALVLVGSVSIGLIAEIIFSRGVRWIFKNLKWLLGAGIVYCLLLIGINADIFGYAAHVPTLDSIESVQVNYTGRFGESDGHPHRYDNNGPPLTDSESIAIVREAHNIAVNNRPPKNSGQEEFSYNSIRIAYKLKNGAAMSRTYDQIYIQASEKLAGLEDKDDFIRAKSALFWAEQNPQLAKVSTVELYASFSGRDGQHTDVLDDPEPLLSAIRADMLEQSLEGIINPPGPSLGFIRINFEHIDMRTNSGDVYNYGGPLYATVTVTEEYRRTLEVLSRLDLNGNFAGVQHRFDDIAKVGLLPAQASYYSSGRIRLFSPWAGEYVPQAPIEQYKEDGFFPYDEFTIYTDAPSIQSIAQASKDMLFIPAGREWRTNYAMAYFEMTDGSVIAKAVELEDLPSGIRAEVLKRLAADFGETPVENTVTYKPAKAAA